MQTPVLETERLILRPFDENDGTDVFECWESDPDVAKYMFWTSHNDINKSVGWAREEASKINSEDWYRFALIEKDGSNLIGTGLIYYEEEVSDWEIAYNLGKKYWGKGFTTEAMSKIIEFAKNELKIRVIVGRHANENEASEKIMKKLGFKFIKDISYECNRGTVIREGKMHVLYL